MVHTNILLKLFSCNVWKDKKMKEKGQSDVNSTFFYFRANGTVK